MRSSAIAIATACAVTGCSLIVDLGGYADGKAVAIAGADGGSPGNDGGRAEDGGDGGNVSPNGVRAVAAGGQQTCGVVGPSLLCWGSNSNGQLGDGTKSDRTAPVHVLGLPAGEVQGVGVGELHACAIVAGDVVCWGEGGSGELGDGKKVSSLGPVKVVGLPAGKTTRVCAGTAFSCAASDGGAHCWGTNGAGQQGIGATGAPIGTAGTVVTGAGPLANVTDVSCGQDHACARTSSGDLYCWGHNDNGTLATSAIAAGSPSPTARKVEGLPGPADLVSISGWHACAIVSGGVWCWGRGDGGMLGGGQNADSSTPVAVTGLDSGVTTLFNAGGATDEDATCALRGSDLLCWGYDQFGRLGDGLTAPRAVPSPVAKLPPNVDRVTGGYDHFCVGTRDATATIACWGHGTNGQLGDGAGVDRSAPVLVKLP